MSPNTAKRHPLLTQWNQYPMWFQDYLQSYLDQEPLAYRPNTYSYDMLAFHVALLNLLTLIHDDVEPTRWNTAIVELLDDQTGLTIVTYSQHEKLAVAMALRESNPQTLLKYPLREWFQFDLPSPILQAYHHLLQIRAQLLA